MEKDKLQTELKAIFTSDVAKEFIGYSEEAKTIKDSANKSWKEFKESGSLDSLIGDLVAFESISRVLGTRRKNSKGNIILPHETSRKFKYSESFKRLGSLINEISEELK